MPKLRLMTLPVVIALAVGAVPILGADALAQIRSGTTTPAPLQKMAPGKACSNLAPNSPAHKDCVAQRAKADKAAKPAKPLKPTKPTKKS
ncbi:MAG: hypothetical protein EXQ95_13315 [Alphaproteobacteria bacterium]|nr:hypothetical protein [Alphaproteobacteria bacterium]